MTEAPGEATPRRSWMPSPAEWGLISIAAVVAATVALWLMRDGWFRWDAWDYVQSRSARTIRGLLGQHAGSLQWFAVVFYRGMIKIVAFDYWPWYVLPRAIGYPLVVIGVWLVVLRRGAPRTIAGAGAVVLMFLGASGFLYDGTVGHLASVTAGVVAVEMLVADRWKGWRSWAFGFAAFMTLTTGEIGAAFYASLWATALIYRRRAVVFFGLAPAGLFYVAWYLRMHNAYNSVSLHDVTTAPIGVLRLLAFHLPRSLGWGWDWLTVALVVVGVVAAMRRPDLRVVTTAWVLTVVAYFALAWAVRIASGHARVSTLRYGLWPSVLLYLAIMPALPRLRVRLDALIAVVALTAALWLNVPVWVNEMRDAAEDGARNRIRAEAAMTLLDAGEPYHPSGRLVMSGGWAVPKGLLRMDREGWDWHPVQDQEELDAARIRIRTMPRPAGVDGVPPCVTLAEGDIEVREIVGKGRVIVTPESGEPTLVTDWLDQWGPSRREDGPRSAMELQYQAGPGATVTWSVTGGVVTLCEPADGEPGF